LMHINWMSIGTNLRTGATGTFDVDQRRRSGYYRQLLKLATSF
jgi:hypothetical protein